MVHLLALLIAAAASGTASCGLLRRKYNGVVGENNLSAFGNVTFTGSWSEALMGNAVDKSIRVFPESFLKGLLSPHNNSSAWHEMVVAAAGAKRAKRQDEEDEESFSLPLDYFREAGFGAELLAQAETPGPIIVPLSATRADVNNEWFRYYGKLFFSINEWEAGVCSALHYTQAIAVTAAHCVRDQHGWFSDMRFVRQYQGPGTGTTFKVLKPVIPTAYMGYFRGEWGDVRYDIAFLILDVTPTRVQTINVRMDFRSTIPSDRVAAAGYPKNYAGAQELFYAYARVERVGDFLYMPENSMAGGCSGGPWQHLDAEDKARYIVGLNSFSLERQRGMYSPMLSGLIRDVRDEVLNKFLPEVNENGNSHVAKRFTVSANLNVREAPRVSARLIETLSKGSVIEVVCQTKGDKIKSGLNTWDKLASGGYVHDAYVRTGHRGFSPSLPRCG